MFAISQKLDHIQHLLENTAKTEHSKYRSAQESTYKIELLIDTVVYRSMPEQYMGNFILNIRHEGACGSIVLTDHDKIEQELLKQLKTRTGDGDSDGTVTFYVKSCSVSPVCNKKSADVYAKGNDARERYELNLYAAIKRELEASNVLT